MQRNELRTAEKERQERKPAPPTAEYRIMIHQPLKISPPCMCALTGAPKKTPPLRAGLMFREKRGPWLVNATHSTVCSSGSHIVIARSASAGTASRPLERLARCADRSRRPVGQGVPDECIGPVRIGSVHPQLLPRGNRIPVVETMHVLTAQWPQSKGRNRGAGLCGCICMAIRAALHRRKVHITAAACER